jgi:tripartite-type tricarboxylate transporter receptor subunit TctC
MKISTAIIASLIAAANTVAAMDAQAQASYPSSPIRILVAYPPGGFPDTTTRILGEQLRKHFNQQIIVENRPSAGTIVAGQAVTRSAPDGYTLLAADSQMWGIAPNTIKDFPFDPINDFEPVSIFATTANFLVTSATVPVTGNLKDLLDYIKANPGKLNYGTAGIGSLHHLTMTALRARTGIEANHVPYKGNAQILPALVSGEVGFAFQSLAALPRFVADGKIRMFAIAANNRSKVFPDIPTFEEFGIKDMEFLGTMALLAPKGTPKDVISKLADAVKAGAQDPEFKKRIDAIGVDSPALAPQETAAWIKREAAALTAAAKEANIKPE